MIADLIQIRENGLCISLCTFHLASDHIVGNLTGLGHIVHQSTYLFNVGRNFLDRFQLYLSNLGIHIRQNILQSLYVINQRILISDRRRNNVV